MGVHRRNAGGNFLIPLGVSRLSRPPLMPQRSAVAFMSKTISHSSPAASGFSLGVDETASSGILRIARDQLAMAMAKARDGRRPLDERVHEARKHCKKLRALVRLVRFQDEMFFAEENAAVRDAAGELSALRDTDAVLAACTELWATCTRPRIRAHLARVRRKLGRQQPAEATGHAAVERKLRRFVRRMRDVHARVLFWPIVECSALHLELGFAEVYRQSRRALRRVLADPSEENFHELRKRVKDHGFHLRLLRDTWPRAIDDRLRDVDRLSEMLGCERDLAMLGHALMGAAGDSRLTGDARALFAFVDQRRVKLRADTLELGRMVLSPGPAELLARLRGWRAAA